MSDKRLDPSALAAIAAAGAQVPRYDRGRPAGIVHLGVGAFHKAHQAAYTETALGASGGDWMIAGVSLRSARIADELNPQDGLYTLLTRSTEGTSARIIGSISEVLVAPRDPAAVLARIAAPDTRIVSLTITEKGYGLDPATGGLDRSHPAVAADLLAPRNPQGAVGFIVEGIRLRRERGLAVLTVLCCDNLPHNGAILRRLVVEFARELDGELASFIEAEIPFPSTMVDRITPASTQKTLDDTQALTGFDDPAAVETEPFSQWIIEDRFASGRPEWEAGGALFVTDVAPYEKMKLRMLNGAHSMLAYAGFIAGHAFVREVMADTDLAVLIERQMQAAAMTLDPVPGIDLDAYAKDLRARFANREIAHQTYQIAMDGTQKLPQRLLEPAMITLRKGLPLDAYAFAVAGWLRYCVGMDETGKRYELRDPREAEIAALVDGAGCDAGSIVDRMFALPGLMPEELSRSDEWNRAVKSRLEIMLAKSMRQAIAAEVGRARAA
ncbi:mannitol dehydrogenase family protein [Arvimicrobium flavum]|uniref:mannitol dehydrogenase family protein n=1 Tax=Arvimicrobium flavum TaxID=3393320 RepID=UPI00237B8E32|nr:mannitol dehydrogenase family protein [Mesorhizobium shangrilense]